MTTKKSASGTTAATQLRTHFGDRKPPDISRRITACVTCRSLKIKCHMSHAKPPCARCKAQGLSCVVNKSLQTLLEGDATWKEDMEQRVSRIEQALLQSVDSNTIDAPIPRNATTTKSNRQDQGGFRQSDHASDTPTSTLDLSCSLGAFPASSIASTSPKQPFDTPSWPDLISRGVVSLASAKQYLEFFHRYLNPSIHYALGGNATVASIRARSSLLTTAICTVASLCSSSDDYSKCLAELKDEATQKLFAESYIFDDALALCIGALWLRDISGTLQSLAVRISSQLDLHRCITKMPHTDISCYRRTILFFLVLLCDHHCSLVGGKPPMTQEWKCLRHPATLLQSEFSTGADLFLVAQVELWSLNRKVFETFGADVHDSAATRNNGQEVERLKDAYEAWYKNWRRALSLDRDSRSQLHYTFELYYHSGRLYLLSHVFRGRNNTVTSSPSNRSKIDPSTQTAFDSALHIVETITTWEEASSWLNTLPWYLCTMLAFACVCLIRISLQLKEVSEADTDRARKQIEQLTSKLRQIGAMRLPLLNIAECLESALQQQQYEAVVQQSDGSGSGSNDFTDFDWDSFWNESMRTDLLGDEAMWLAFVNENDLQLEVH